MHTPSQAIFILRNFLKIQAHQGACVGLSEIALDDLEKFIEYAFEAHPNLDLDIKPFIPF